MNLNPDVFLQRRLKLAKQVENGVVILFNQPLPQHHAQTHQIDNDLYYLSGLTEERTALILFIENGKLKDEIAYCLRKNDEYERWHGKLLGPTRTKNDLDLLTVNEWKSYNDVIKEAFALSSNIFIKFNTNPNILKLIFALAKTKHDMIDYKVIDLRHHLAKLRVVKDKYEIKLIKESCAIAAQTQLDLIGKIYQAKTEHEIAAFINYQYTKQDATHAFTPIVANGANACIAHYIKNNAKLRNGNLLLIDSGCNKNYYCSDITRVYPKNKKFSPEQKQMYNIVLAAQRAAINLIKPGKTLDSLQKAAKRVLAQGLRDLGIVSGTIPVILKSSKFKKYYFHNIGHMLGLDVHDPNPAVNNKSIKFTKNMVITIEPGLYFDSDPSVPKEIRNTGIRIEDTVMVTSSGYKVLTDLAPKKINQIEELMAQ